MSITRRHILAAVTASTLLAMPGMAQAAETVRIGLPTKTYWPTIIAETAMRQKLFEKEGINAELTIYRGGAESFEAMAAGAADSSSTPPSRVAAGLKKGVMSKFVANAAIGYYGWQLMVLGRSRRSRSRNSNGKKVGITSAGSGSDILALWTAAGQQDRTSPACRSAAAAWCRTCSPAISTPPCSIRRSASRSAKSGEATHAARLRQGSAAEPRPAAGSRPTRSSRRSRRWCRRR